MSLLDCCRYNKISLNPFKSKYMLVSNKPIVYEPQVILDEIQMPRTDNFKYTGFDGKTFRSQIKVQ